MSKQSWTGSKFGDDTFDAMNSDPNAEWTLDGKGGNDTISGGNANDTIYGGDGKDTLDGRGGENYLWGEEGNDTFIGGDALINHIHGQNGQDTVDYSAQSGNVTVDLVAGTGGVQGHFGIDYIDGVENVTGGTGDDRLTGDTNDNVLLGGGGNDTLTGGDGNDTLTGGNGDDTLEGGLGRDTLNGGGGNFLLDYNNTASYEDSASAVNVSLATGTGHGGDAEGDTLINIQNLTGSDQGDFLTGDSGKNILDGRGGDDYLFGSAGGDVYEGGDGIDTVDFYNSTTDIALSLRTGQGTGGDAAGATFEDIENVNGGSGNDTIVGDDKNNVLRGFGGNDTIQGGHGKDTLTGGTGNDNFVYTQTKDSPESSTAHDLITDFKQGGDKDTIDLSQIDADANDANGRTAFHFSASGPDNTTGDVWYAYDATANVTRVYANHGDSNNNLEIDLTGNVNLNAHDFHL